MGELGVEERGFLLGSETAVTDQCQGVETLGIALGLEEHTQLMHLSLLGLGQVAGVAVLLHRRRGREVIVVVLRIELHGGDSSVWPGKLVGERRFLSCTQS